MSARNNFNLSNEAAKGYESQKVPAIFAPIGQGNVGKIKFPDNSPGD
jgi:hypothetical protein